MVTAASKDRVREPLFHIAKFNAAYARAPDPMKKKYLRQHATINKARVTIKKMQRANKSPSERSDYIKSLFLQSKPLDSQTYNDQLPSYLTLSTASALSSSPEPSQPTEEQQR